VFKESPMSTALRDVPQQAIDLIKAFEGIPDGDPSTVNIDAYLCPAGVWTIGWGHAIVDGGVQLKGAAGKARARALYPGGITREQAETLLRADLIPRAAQLGRMLKVAVDDAQFGALVSLLFNIGGANLAASTLLRKLNAGDRLGAADQFLAWDKARVSGVLQALPGLTRRRRAERAMFLGEDWMAASAMPARRSRGAVAQPEVLPVPVMPAEDRAAMRQAAVKKTAAKKTAGKKVASKTAAAKKAAAKRPAAKKPATPRARTTAPTAPRRPR
jgi:lysozyme